MGGFNGVDCERRMEIYDEASGNWSYYGNMGRGRVGFAATVFRKHIYVLGGWAYVYLSLSF